MIIFRTKSKHQFVYKDGSTETFTGELSLPALDAIQAATAAIQAISLAAGNAATVTNIVLQVSIDHDD